MSALKSAVIAQFKRPHGALGIIAGNVMALRPSNRLRNRWTLDLLDLQPTDHVFELGCGPGYALSRAARRVPKAFVTGVDHSETMVRMARARLSGPMRRAQANVMVGGELILKSYDATLNAVYSANVIQFLGDPSAYFRLAHAALKPGGRMATTYQPRGVNPSPTQAEMIAQTCKTAAHAAGFDSVGSHTLPLKGAPAICVLAVK